MYNDLFGTTDSVLAIFNLYSLVRLNVFTDQGRYSPFDLYMDEKVRKAIMYLLPTAIIFLSDGIFNIVPSNVYC